MATRNNAIFLQPFVGQGHNGDVLLPFHCNSV